LSAINKDEEAIKWYEESIEKLHSHPTLVNSARFCPMYNNLGLLHSKYKEFNEAKKYFFNSKNQAERINYNRMLGTIYNNIGDLALKQGDTATALEYFKKAEEISKKVNNVTTLALTYTNYGEMNIKLGRFHEAEAYLLEAKRLTKDFNINWLKIMIDDNLALAKNRISNFNRFYKFLWADYPEILQNKITSVNPLIKSYLVYLYEIGDRTTIEAILYSDIDFHETQDEDFYYQILAMLSIFKRDYQTGINNYKIALEYARQSTSSYSIAINSVYLANCHCLNNEPEKAREYLDSAEVLIKANKYGYWDVFKEIIRLKVDFLRKEVPLRNILRAAFALLPEISKNSYFLLEIELYGIIIHIYKEIGANKLAQNIYKQYSEKVRDAIRGLPESDQKRYFSNKKVGLKNINEFNIYYIAARKQVKSSNWNEEILPLLRLEDTERIKFFLNQKIKEYFAPHCFAVFIFNANTIPRATGLLQQDSSLYMQSNLDVSLLSQKEIILNANKAIEKNHAVTFTLNKRHTIITPLMLKHSKIGRAHV
jgi:tetratricopeptide (TPR) repeat protein